MSDEDWDDWDEEGEWEPPTVVSPEELNPDHDLILCVSGGKDSSAMALWLFFESGLENRKFLIFSDTGHEHPWTTEHVHRLAEKVGQHLYVLRGKRKFLNLCEHKQRFPAPYARFCTEELKVLPASEWLEEMYGGGHIDNPVLCQGIRWQESEARSKATNWDRNNKPGYHRRVFECPIWRPIIDWTHSDVFAIHKRHNFEPNPLYKLGARRVGCFPCIFSSKVDLRACFDLDPQLLDRLRDYERRVGKRATRGFAHFFSPNKIPAKYHDREAESKDGIHFTYASIDAVYQWAMSDYSVFDKVDKGPRCWSHYGLCE